MFLYSTAGRTRFRRLILPVLLMFCLSVSRFAAAAHEDAAPLVRKTFFGVFLHDRGPASDQHAGFSRY